MPTTRLAMFAAQAVLLLLGVLVVQVPLLRLSNWAVEDLLFRGRPVSDFWGPLPAWILAVAAYLYLLRDLWRCHRRAAGFTQLRGFTLPPPSPASRTE